MLLGKEKLSWQVLHKNIPENPLYHYLMFAEYSTTTQQTLLWSGLHSKCLSFCFKSCQINVFMYIFSISFRGKIIFFHPAKGCSSFEHKLIFNVRTCSSCLQFNITCFQGQYVAFCCLRQNVKVSQFCHPHEASFI